MRSRRTEARSQDQDLGEFSQNSTEERRTTIIRRSAGIDPAHQKWLREERGIDPDIAAEQGCCSVTLRFSTGRESSAFLTPCIMNGVEVAWSARWNIGAGGGMKGFVSSPDARLNLVFADQVNEQDYVVCDNKGMKPMTMEEPFRVVVITEGQLDALAVRMAGFVGISIPNGTKSTHWIERWADKLANCRRVVLWMDDDEDGRELLDKLLRELWGNIYLVNAPKAIDDEKIKDANDLLRKGGVGAVKEAILSSRSRMGGKYNIIPSKLYHPVTSFPTGLQWMDERMVLCAGEQTAVVGKTNRGKSKLINFWAYQAARHNGERIYFQSLEAVADGELTADLAEFEMGMPIEEILPNADLYREALHRLQPRVVALEPSLVPRSKDPMGSAVARMIEQACEGVRIHVIDNYAMLQTASGMNENAQTRADINLLNEAARRYDIAVAVCYHARKPPAQYMVRNMPPEIEDASGAAAIGNHCGLGVTVERVMEKGVDTNMVNIAIRKARRKIHGRRCDFNAYFDAPSQSYRFGAEGFAGIDNGIRKKNNKGSERESQDAPPPQNNARPSLL